MPKTSAHMMLSFTSLATLLKAGVKSGSTETPT